MILDILTSNVQNFIKDNLKTDVRKLALKKNLSENIDYKEIINQIVAKKKAEIKLPTWFNCKNIYYPKSISIEQTSSEATAKYKSSLIFGETIVDLSGGFGIDCFYFAENFKQVYHCEQNTELSEIVAYNYNIFNKTNITCISNDSFEFLKQTDIFFDYIYLDPSRRSEIKGKVFLLKDCEPNLPKNLDFYFTKTNNILVKTSPILDVSAGLNEIGNVKNIHIVAVNNEVKEILWQLEKNYIDEIKVFAVNIEKSKTFINEFLFNEKANYKTAFPQKFLYEPNAAIFKSGEVNALCDLFDICKLQEHSHLFINNDLIDFPGRRFKIDFVLPYQKTEIDKYLKGKKMNVTTRNFPLQVEEIRKKHKIADGGNVYSFFTTNQNNEKIVLLCTKI